jgi:hypothetical protein
MTAGTPEDIMIERLHAIQEMLQYLSSEPRVFSRRERRAFYVMMQDMTKSIESWLTRETHNAELALTCLKQIQAEMDEPRSTEAKIDAISLKLKEFHTNEMPF